MVTGPLFLIDIACAILPVFSLNDEIIIYHMITLLYYLMNGWVDRAILGPICYLCEF